jgi:hypothetical protein
VSAIPLADAPRFRRLARRTTIVRIGLALLLAGLLAAAVAAAFAGGGRRAAMLPAHADSIVVLDLSASISADTFTRIATTLAALAADPERVGLVLFSSSAYEALPPGTPARELGSLTRFFRARKAGPGFAPTFPTNPWTESFSSGTAISSGLRLAASIVRRDRLGDPAVVLVSDLDDDPQDRPRLARTAADYRRLGLPLRIVSLGASTPDLERFRKLFAGGVSVRPAALRPQASASPGTGFPVWLACAAVAVAALLAASELWAPALDWRAETAR